MRQAEDGSMVPDDFWGPVARPDDQSLADRVRGLESRLANAERQRSRSNPNLRGLADCEPLTKVADGQVPVYSKALGQWKPGTPASGGGGGIPPFVLSGSLYIVTSEKWPPPTTTTVSRLYGVLVAAGSTSTTVELLKNGTVVGTLVIPASSLATAVAITPVTFTGPEADLMQMRTTAVGAGASGLTVQPA